MGIVYIFFGVAGSFAGKMPALIRPDGQVELTDRDGKAYHGIESANIKIIKRFHLN
jgi:hypothetical protein